VRYWGVIFLGLDLVLQIIFRGARYGVENRGVSFGLAPEVGFVISLLAFSFLIGWYFYEKAKGKRFLYLSLLALGGVGNIVCRLVWGSVWDYICLPFLSFCFNLSDVLISLGVVSYILGVNGNRSTLRGQRDTGNQ
jgi:lipoprotein signal peptidase